MNLFRLIDNVQKGDQYALEQVVDMFKPKINSLLRQTNGQNRDDLRQELFSLLIAKSQNYNLDEVPGLDEFMNKEII